MSGWRTAWQGTQKRSYFMKAMESTKAIHPTCSPVKSRETSKAQKVEGWTSNGSFKSRHQCSAIHHCREVGAWPQVLHPVCATNNRLGDAKDGTEPPHQGCALSSHTSTDITTVRYCPWRRHSHQPSLLCAHSALRPCTQLTKPAFCSPSTYTADVQGKSHFREGVPENLAYISTTLRGEQ